MQCKRCGCQTDHVTITLLDSGCEWPGLCDKCDRELNRWLDSGRAFGAVAMLAVAGLVVWLITGRL